MAERESFTNCAIRFLISDAGRAPVKPVPANVGVAAIIGVPEQIAWGRLPQGQDLPYIALNRLLADHGVAKFKAPEEVAIWDTLPKNDAGKVLKHRIRAQLMEERACQ